MKFIILFVILFSIIINADILDIMHNDWIYDYSDDFIFINTAKDLFSYDIGIVYFNSFNTYNIQLGFNARIFDNIELTAIPFADSSISVNNMPYVYDNVCAYIYKLPVSLIIIKKNLQIAVNINTYFSYLYNNIFISNTINTGFLYKQKTWSVESNIINLIGEIFYNDLFSNYYYEPVINIKWYYNIFDNNNLNIYSGLYFTMSKSNQMNYNFKYNNFGFNRSLIIGIDYNSMRVRAYLFSPYFEFFFHYDINKDFFIDFSYTNISNLNKMKIGIGKIL